MRGQVQAAGFGPAAHRAFPHTTTHTPASLVELLKTRSYYLVADADEQARTVQGVRSLVAEHPSLVQRFWDYEAGMIAVMADVFPLLTARKPWRARQAINDALHTRTRLVVAHRPGTAASADLVAWLDDGRVRALAPHEVLLREPGYRAVFTAPELAGGS